MLVKIGTSTYSQVFLLLWNLFLLLSIVYDSLQNRVKAQIVLVNLLKDYPFAHKSIIGDLVKLLDPANDSSHEQIKVYKHIPFKEKLESMCAL